MKKILNKILNKLNKTQINKLKMTIRKAKDISRAKSFFLAQVSHDLRQPISALRMFVYHLKKESLSKKEKPLVENIDILVENLDHLLNNLMDIARSDYKQKDYKPQEFEISKSLKDICLEYKAIAKAKNIKFDVKIDKIIIHSDEFFLERIIRNLLSNAFKFTKDEILFSIEEIENQKVRIIIKDNGCGIKKNEMKYIFNEFFQSKYVEKQKIDGVGLGLPIVQKISKMLNIEISVISKYQKGVEFELLLNK